MMMTTVKFSLFAKHCVYIYMAPTIVSLHLSSHLEGEETLAWRTKLTCSNPERRMTGKGLMKSGSCGPRVLSLRIALYYLLGCILSTFVRGLGKQPPFPTFSCE